MMKLIIIFLSLVLLQKSFAKLEMEQRNLLQAPLPFAVFGDNQFHNLFSGPHVWRSGLESHFVSASLRPVPLDMNSGALMKWWALKYAAGNFIIHTGDSLDSSCKQEWSRFTQHMRNILNTTNPKGWVMALGNHDGFYQGVDFPEIFSKNDWRRACSDDFNIIPVEKKDIEKVMTKRDAIKGYLEELFYQANKFGNGLFPKGYSDFKCESVKRQFIGTPINICNWESKNPNGQLRKVQFGFSLDEKYEFAYQGYIIQEVYGGKVDGKDLMFYLIDTSDYSLHPKFARGVANKMGIESISLNPGVNCDITEEQRKGLEKWLMVKPKNSISVIFSHYDFDHYSRGARERFLTLVPLLGDFVMVSAHTHNGYQKDQGVFHEVNIGSMTDFPNEWFQMKLEKGKFVYARRRITPQEIGGEFCDPKKYNYNQGPFSYTGWLRKPDLFKNDIPTYVEYAMYNAFKRISVDLKLNKEISLPKGCDENKVRSKPCQKLLGTLQSLLREIDELTFQGDQRRITYGACQVLFGAAQHQEKLRAKQKALPAGPDEVLKELEQLNASPNECPKGGACEKEM